MSIEPPAGDYDDSGPVAAVVPLPTEFENLYLANQEAFHDYARARLGSNEAAVEVVHQAFLEILADWDELEAQHNFLQLVWATFRAAVETAAARRTALARGLDAFRRDLALVDGESSDITEALRSLPPRQFDALILRSHKVRLDDISWYMGVSNSTVDYHCRKGRERLAQALPARIKRNAYREDTK
jgi:RNA polymerase sigma-70 factor (ECF subfamily)